MALLTCDVFSEALQRGTSMNVVLPQPTQKQIGACGTPRSRVSSTGWPRRGPRSCDVWHTAPMADTGKPDDGTDDGPSLEMPSFSLRRKKNAPPPEDATPEPAPVEVEPEPIAQPEPAPTAVIPPPQPAYEPPTTVVPVVHEPEVVHHEAEEPEPDRREIPLAGLPAAVATGVAVGILAVLLAWLAGVGCEAARGTSSCGGGPGFLILLLVLVALAGSGSWLLDRFGVPESGSTSLLAVGIMAVLVMVFLLGSLDSWWAAIAIPVTAVIGYAVSWWVTNAVVGDDTEAEVPEPHDVR